mgnify:CR=1 FL=1
MFARQRNQNLQHLAIQSVIFTHLVFHVHLERVIHDGSVIVKCLHQLPSKVMHCRLAVALFCIKKKSHSSSLGLFERTTHHAISWVDVRAWKSPSHRGHAKEFANLNTQFFHPIHSIFHGQPGLRRNVPLKIGECCRQFIFARVEVPCNVLQHLWRQEGSNFNWNEFGRFDAIGFLRSCVQLLQGTRHRLNTVTSTNNKG